MRIIQIRKDDHKLIEVSWMWLPWFIANNTGLLRELDHVLNLRYETLREINENNLNEIHYFVIEFICDRVKVAGLKQFLEGLAYVGKDPRTTC
jgi:hypothetical protein